MVHETITLEGHLIDSDIMRRVFDHVVEDGGEFEVLEFRVGTDATTSPRSPGSRCGRADPQTSRPDPGRPALPRGDDPGRRRRFAPAEADGILPDDFYSTTNFETWLRDRGQVAAGRATRRWTARS